MFKKKIKKDKSEKRKGCLQNLIVFVVITVLLGILLVVNLRDNINIFGVNLSTFNEYAAWLNEDVNEQQLTKNPIRETDYATFKTKANEAGLSVFDLNGNVNFNIPSIAIYNNLTLFDYELGAMINNATKQENNGQLINFLEISIAKIDNAMFTLTSVVKFDLKEIKAAIGKNANKVPDSIYVTCVGNAYVVGSRVQTRDNEIFINQLSKDKNDKLVQFIKDIAEETENNQVLEIFNINNYIVTEILTDVAQKTNTNPVLGNGTFSLILK